MVHRITKLILFINSNFTLAKVIILASQSPRRKKLLQQIGISFSVEPSTCDESYDDNEAPSKIVQMLAERKALDVAQSKKDALVIGADTIVVFKNKILEKPKTQREAAGMLRSLSGASHSVLTGVSLVRTDKKGNILAKETFFEQTVVYFGDLDDSEIEAYVSGGSPMDKAGAYGIQDDWGTLFVERIEGDYNNVVGLPLFALYRHLKKFAPEYMQQMSLKQSYA